MTNWATLVLGEVGFEVAAGFWAGLFYLAKVNAFEYVALVIGIFEWVTWTFDLVNGSVELANENGDESAVTAKILAGEIAYERLENENVSFVAMTTVADFDCDALAIVLSVTWTQIHYSDAMMTIWWLGPGVQMKV